MGYSYERTASGRHALCCDACGKSGGVRKRTCKYKVTHNGFSIPYCPPPALCSNCYATHKATLHDGCKAGAEASQAREDARQAQLQSGESLSSVGFGSWHDLVPDGMVGRGFKALDGTMTFVLLPNELDQTRGDALSAYPEAVPWTAMAERENPETSKEVVVV